MNTNIQSVIDSPKDNAYIIVSKSLDTFSIPNGAIVFEKDNFLISDSRSLIKTSIQTFNDEIKKVFINTKQINIYAQNSILKLFEDVPKNTFFYLIVPTKEILLNTLVSRCTVVEDGIKFANKNSNEIMDFIKLNSANKLNYIEKIYQTSKELGHRDNIRNFLDGLEIYLHQTIENNKAQTNPDNSFFNAIHKSRTMLNKSIISKNILSQLAFVC